MMMIDNEANNPRRTPEHAAAAAAAASQQQQQQQQPIEESKETVNILLKTETEFAMRFVSPERVAVDFDRGGERHGAHNWR